LFSGLKVPSGYPLIIQAAANFTIYLVANVLDISEKVIFVPSAFVIVTLPVLLSFVILTSSTKGLKGFLSLTFLVEVVVSVEVVVVVVPVEVDPLVHLPS